MDQPCSGCRFKRIMVVDDAHIDRFLLEKLVKKHCFAEEVLSIESASAALKHLSAQQADTLPQVIFLDINMPEMSGFEFLDAYANFPDSIKNACTIVMLSSSLHPDDRERAAGNPYVKIFLNKPLNPERLLEISSW